MGKRRALEGVLAPTLPRDEAHAGGIPSNPKFIPWRTFFESKVQDAADPSKYRWRIFAYKVPTLDVLIGNFAMAAPAARYADTPKLAAKRRRNVERALRRGRRTQVAKKIASFTGTEG